MGVTALCFRLLMLEFTLLNSYTLKSDAAFLRVTPNRLQHFEHNSVTFDCKGSDGSTHLRVIRNTQESDVKCDTKTPTGSCTIKRVYRSDGGEFWCETEGGERSNSVNISVTAGDVIMEIPALPVTEGDDVTLSCRSKTTSSSNLPAGFYRGGKLVQSSSAREMTIHNVSKSDEGVYNCRISGVGDSPGSWLAVRELLSENDDSDDSNSDSDGSQLLILLSVVVVTILMAVLMLVVVGVLHMRIHRVSSKTPTAASLSDEDSHNVYGEDAAEDLDDVTYAVVVTKPRKNKDDDDDESSLQPVYSTLTMSKTPHDLQQESGLLNSAATPRSTAAEHSEQEPLYAPVLKKR
ncbi:uncharacterized protein LOC119481851 isoform X2 [Sebastes umbrosus]|uniref:uncharacterized protein LOC119481851 isoform X2 n=1 Tax=Sebastes umbrosus TaxID=72105 RepID=UPI00189DAE26|nr:uncharacterized protein LOC119481851 isoform X2 [Sebastes umbrosus]